MRQAYHRKLLYYTLYCGMIMFNHSYSTDPHVVAYQHNVSCVTLLWLMEANPNIPFQHLSNSSSADNFLESMTLRGTPHDCWVISLQSSPRLFNWSNTMFGHVNVCLGMHQSILFVPQAAVDRSTKLVLIF